MINKLDPPPSVVELVKDNPIADAQWKLWLNNLYEKVNEDMVKDFFFEVSCGRVEGMFSINVPGHSGNISTLIGTVGNYNNALQVYSALGSADIDSISSSSASDTHDMTIIGLDADYNLVKQNVTLNGQARVALGVALNRVQLVYNRQTTAAQTVGEVFVYVNTAITGGIPTDTTKIRSYIALTSGISNETDSNSVKTVPAGKVGLIVFGKTTVTDSKALELTFWGRPAGGVFVQKHHIDIKNSNYDYFFKSPLLVQEKTDIEVRATIDVGTGECTVNYDVVIMDKNLLGKYLNPIYLEPF